MSPQLSTLGMLATAIVAQVTYGSLVSHADDEAIPTTATSNITAFAMNWLAAGLSILACAAASAPRSKDGQSNTHRICRRCNA